MSHDVCELSLVEVPELDAARGAVFSAAYATPARVALCAETAGPGWFDSSFELRRGLVVSEGSAADLGLRLWLDSYLGAERRNSSRTARPRSITAIA